MSREPILIVDDNPMNRKLTRILLEVEGYAVRTAVDVQDALKAISDFRPRLILMDFQMPGQDGVFLTRKLKDQPETRDIVIIILTSYDLKGEEEQARAAGCDAYLAKPIDTQQLPKIVGKYLRGDGTSPQGAPGAKSTLGSDRGGDDVDHDQR